jgi:hypothetical protein
LRREGGFRRRTFCDSKKEANAGPCFPPYDSVKRLALTTLLLAVSPDWLPGLYWVKVARKACRKCQTGRAAISEILAVDVGICRTKCTIEKRVRWLSLWHRHEWIGYDFIDKVKGGIGSNIVGKADLHWLINEKDIGAAIPTKAVAACLGVD